MDASIIGAAAVTLATSYAFGDVFGLKHSLHRGFADAKQFYLSYTAMVALAAAIVLIPGAPLGLITTAVQALAGLLLPSASVFLCCCATTGKCWGPGSTGLAQLGRRDDRRNPVAVVGNLDGHHLVPQDQRRRGCRLPGVALVVLGVARSTGAAVDGPTPTCATAPKLPAREVDRNSWRMPPLTLLEPVVWSPLPASA